MKKSLKVIVVLVVIIGLCIGGYLIYKKFTGADIASELGKVEINPDERKELVENLTTEDEKIEMIIQLIEDINQHKISYSYPKIGRFYVEGKYELDYEIKPYAALERDYMGKPYIAGSKIKCTMRINNSRDVYGWIEYKNSLGDITDYQFTDTHGNPTEAVKVDLELKDELVLGKGTMLYTNKFEAEFSEELEDFKTNRKYLSLEETDGVYTLRSGANKIETDGISYIKNSQWYIELNNKALYEKIIKPIENVKSFPIITEGEDIESKSKYNRNQLLKDYIASIEPKNQVWNVEDIQDFYFTEGFLYNNLYGKTTIGNDFYMSGILSSSSASQNLQSSIEIIFKESYIYDALENGVRTIEIKVDKNGVATVSKGTLNDYLFELIIKIESDDSFTVNYRTHLDLICDNERIIKDCLITETGKFVNEKIDKTTLTCNSKLTLNSYSFIDSNNNEYLLLGEKTYKQLEEYSLLTTFVDYYLFN